MPSVIIWTPESDYDAKAVLLLSEKLVAHFGIKISINIKGKPDRQVAKKGSTGLKNAIKNYLQEDLCVIFVIDHDGPQAQANRRQEPNSLINQIEKVVKLKEFQGRVHLVEAVNELEAWLLIDCTGIFCYFAQNHHALPKTCKQNLCSRECRDKIRQHKTFWRLITKYTSGDTASIEEPEQGSDKGVKEYLIKFSEEIYQVLHPEKHKMDKNSQYKEALAPKIAEYIEINDDTLKRSESLTHLGYQLKACVQMIEV
ncbi:MAG: hypothetical protein DRR00_20675 [Candidatus Parabeggiatoa sp. nov. 3]|nr:MAG: hypothetical protein DRR00_20675 [Gammaproteobacteria bacterium]